MVSHKVMRVGVVQTAGCTYASTLVGVAAAVSPDSRLYIRINTSRSSCCCESRQQVVHMYQH